MKDFMIVTRVKDSADLWEEAYRTSCVIDQRKDEIDRLEVDESIEISSSTTLHRTE